MGKPRGFLEIQREEARRRPVEERLGDWREFELVGSESELRPQAARCMDCGIPYCHWACPLGNLIPDFNDHLYRGLLELGLDSLHATNNFPEITGRVCPAPCEQSCTLSLERAPVTIKQIERALADRGFERGLVRPEPAPVRTGKRVAVVGSGPAGLAAAQELARAGHTVVVFEKNDRLGGILRYGIPDFKLDKRLIDRRIDQMLAEGVVFRAGTEVGEDVPAAQLRSEFDAVVLAGGAEQPRELLVPGRQLRGVHLAMEFLTQQNRRNAGDWIPEERSITATGKRVVILGGGDTGADCLGTALRQGAREVTQIELLPEPPRERPPLNPWPEWPRTLRSSSSHEEGGRRLWGLMTTELLGDEQGRVRALRAVRVIARDGQLEPVPGSEQEFACELVLLALGFVGTVQSRLLSDLGVELDARGNVKTEGFRTSVPSVFATGDQARGQSLVVWAIADGRRCAEMVDRYLRGAAGCRWNQDPSKSQHGRPRCC